MARGVSQLPVQWNVALSFGRSTPFSETKTSGLAELKVMKTWPREVKISLVSVASLFYPWFFPWFLSLWSWLWEKPHFILDADSKLILRLLPLNWCYNCVFKRPFYLSIRPAALGYGKTSEFHDCGPTVATSLTEMNSLVRNNTVWNIISEDQHSVSPHWWFWQKHCVQEGKSITRIALCSSEDKSVFLSTKEVVQWSQPAPPGCCW